MKQAAPTTDAVLEQNGVTLTSVALSISHRHSLEYHNSSTVYRINVSPVDSEAKKSSLALTCHTLQQ